MPYFETIYDELEDLADKLGIPHEKQAEWASNWKQEIQDLHADNTALRERIRTLEAGIEREAADLDELAVFAGEHDDLPLMTEHSARAARLRALPKPKP